ncbi:MAG: energy transducer TonB [Gammaproteobacteria bacterium]|nr:energy transducer TonB [Gammaproteobacteria bacterium]
MRLPQASTLAAPVLAAGVTTGLFLFMASLIRMPEGPVPVVKPATPLDFVSPRLAPTDVKSPKTEPEAAPQLSARPSPIANIDLPPEKTGVQIEVPPGRVDIKGSGNEMTRRWGGPDAPVAPKELMAGGDNLMPLLRREPVYPPEAARAGVQGWVELEFSVLPDGSVGEIRVLAAKPRLVFEKAAQRALAGWKYQAEIGGGIRRGNRVRLDFRLENLD